MMHVGNDATKESNWAIKRTKKVHRVIEYIEKQSQKYVLLYALVAPNFRAKQLVVALWGFKIPSRLGCGNFSKRDDRNGLTSCYYFLLREVCNLNQLPRVRETEGTLQIYYSSEKYFNMLEM
jgi:hypothetical protein